MAIFITCGHTYLPNGEARVVCPCGAVLELGKSKCQFCGSEHTMSQVNTILEWCNETEDAAAAAFYAEQAEAHYSETCTVTKGEPIAVGYEIPLGMHVIDGVFLPACDKLWKGIEGMSLAQMMAHQIVLDIWFATAQRLGVA
jgi:hypothetical protein